MVFSMTHSQWVTSLGLSFDPNQDRVNMGIQVNMGRLSVYSKHLSG